MVQMTPHDKAIVMAIPGNATCMDCGKLVTITHSYDTVTGSHFHAYTIPLFYFRHEESPMGKRFVWDRLLLRM